MDTIIQFLQNANGGYDIGSMVTLFGLMIAIDGIVMTIYAIIKGFHGR